MANQISESIQTTSFMQFLDELLEFGFGDRDLVLEAILSSSGDSITFGDFLLSILEKKSQELKSQTSVLHDPISKKTITLLEFEQKIRTIGFVKKNEIQKLFGDEKNKKIGLLVFFSSQKQKNSCIFLIFPEISIVPSKYSFQFFNCSVGFNPGRNSSCDSESPSIEISSQKSN